MFDIKTRNFKQAWNYSYIYPETYEKVNDIKKKTNYVLNFSHVWKNIP